MVKSKLPNAVPGKIWKLGDVDQDGQLDTDEFALANYLINLKLEGEPFDCCYRNKIIVQVTNCQLSCLLTWFL